MNSSPNPVCIYLRILDIYKLFMWHSKIIRCPSWKTSLPDNYFLQCVQTLNILFGRWKPIPISFGKSEATHVILKSRTIVLTYKINSPWCLKWMSLKSRNLWIVSGTFRAVNPAPDSLENRFCQMCTHMGRFSQSIKVPSCRHPWTTYPVGATPHNALALRPTRNWQVLDKWTVVADCCQNLTPYHIGVRYCMRG